LAEKDAELAQTLEQWSQALRLSQEAVAERDARLFEFAHDWTKVGRSLSQLRAYCRRNRMPERPIILCVYHNLIGLAHGALSETIT
jgi:hypothetical protein